MLLTMLLSARAMYRNGRPTGTIMSVDQQNRKA
jgi:hypothetical protein